MVSTDSWECDLPFATAGSAAEIMATFEGCSGFVRSAEDSVDSITKVCMVSLT